MRPDSDPVRLAADPATDPWLKTVLSDGHAQASSPVDVERLTARVQAAIVAGIPGHDVPLPAKHPLNGLVGGKAAIVGAGIAIGMAVGTVWTMHRASHSRVSPAPSVVSSVVEAPANQSIGVQAPSAPAESATTAELTPPAAASGPQHDNHPTGLSEAALLAQARSVLATNPRRALALTQEHAKRFPQGALTQEREVIAIEALSRLGQTDAARSRGSDFERRYPGSAHQPKIDQATRGK